MNLFHEGYNATRPSEYNLTMPNVTLDIYNTAKRKGLLAPHLAIQLRKSLSVAFQKMVTQLTILDPAVANGHIFSMMGNPVCFNYKTQFLRLALIKCLCYCLPDTARKELDLPGIHFMDNYDDIYITAYKRIFNYLAALDAYDVILWFFFQVPIWPNYPTKGINGYRQVYEIMLDYALLNWPITAILTKGKYEKISLGSTYYYNLAYHGLSNKILISKFNTLLRHIYPSVIYTASHIISSDRLTAENMTPGIRYYINRDDKLKYLLEIFDKERLGITQQDAIHLTRLNTPQVTKIRICFISNKLTSYSSVFRDRIGIINNLDPRYFDISIAVFKPLDRIFTSANPIPGKLLSTYRTNQKIIELHPFDLSGNQQTIAKHRFDIVFYPDLGMYQDQTLLAHARLAPIQIATWGHSDTSGNPEIDYYITSRHFENTTDLTIPKNNYSEKPILMNSLGTYYYSPRDIIKNNIDPAFEQGFLSSDRLGFPNDAIVIGCLQSFFKFTEEFENIISTILLHTTNRRRPVIIAMSNSIPFNKIHLDRLHSKLGKHADRLRWFQNKSPSEWLNLVSVCHIMLDPFPFGGCNTSLEAFSYGIPVVCLPSDRVNGRFTYGFYQTMGIDTNLCCAGNEKEYLRLACKLIDDEYYYKIVREKIQANQSKLFEQYDSIREYQSVLTTLVTRHLSPTHFISEKNNSAPAGNSKLRAPRIPKMQTNK